MGCAIDPVASTMLATTSAAAIIGLVIRYISVIQFELRLWRSSDAFPIRTQTQMPFNSGPEDKILDYRATFTGGFDQVDLGVWASGYAWFSSKQLNGTKGPGYAF
jgi:hypothetical protein